MREYVFRGKRIDTKEWVYGGIVTDDPKGAQIVRWNSFGLGYLETYVVDPDTVGQYTGLTDKNGVKIFEGDVVAFGTGRPHEVKFADGSFYMEGTAITIHHADKTVVIGNIHDNPELLEEVSDNG